MRDAIRQITTGAAKAVPTAAAEPLADSTSELVARRGVLVQADKDNGSPVYVGGSTVTTANGFALAAGESVVLPVDSPARIYCIAGSGGQVIRIVVT